MTEEIARIKRLVENDGNGELKATLAVAQSDIISLLCEFMEVQNLNMTVDMLDGGYKLTIDVDVKRFFAVGKLSDGA